MTGRYARPPSRTARVTETSDYVAMLTRMIQGYGRRIGEDPAALVHLPELQNALRDAVNHGMYLANQPGSNGQPGYSQSEQAAMLSVSRQAAAKRIKLGEAVHVRLQVLAGDGAVVRIADIRAQRAAGLAAAGVEDRTGSVRELAAGNRPEATSRRSEAS
ncbi:hypothetical protein [Actinomadura sp. K4S16]|uniref:hypothetical protein n=1 Tax=Actinomadura sp. K4S16 TaxID=1316147 RepID=UPI0011EE9FE4|nr:hypothetical protein [Actinomadura sp. K4S16]